MKLPFAILFSILTLALAQQDSGLKEAVKGSRPLPKTRCKYSCPLRDTAGTPLIAKQSSYGWDFDGYFVGAVNGRAGKGKGESKGKGWYDIFECVYDNPGTAVTEHTCSYFKTDGTHALGSKGDHCPSQAPACPASAVSPVLGLPEDEQGLDELELSSIPHFSSSQLEGAASNGPPGAGHRFKDSIRMNPWTELAREWVWLKEHPPVKID